MYRGREDAGGPTGGESGRIALFEMLAISDEMSDLIETEASRAEIDQNLTGAHYCSFEQYARILLEKGYVAPSHVERALPRKPELLLN